MNDKKNGIGRELAARCRWNWPFRRSLPLRDKWGRRLGQRHLIDSPIAKKWGKAKQECAEQWRLVKSEIAVSIEVCEGGSV